VYHREEKTLTKLTADLTSCNAFGGGLYNNLICTQLCFKGYLSHEAHHPLALPYTKYYIWRSDKKIQGMCTVEKIQT